MNKIMMKRIIAKTMELVIVSMNSKADKDHTHPAQTNITGNAGTASKLLKSIKIGNASFNGSSSITLSQMGAAAESHTHDDRYYTEPEIDIKLSSKASSSHTHTKSNITDFPTSLPASDVSTWAKAANKPSYSWNEINGKPDTFTPATHNHDDRYYTESEIDSKLSDKANSSHGTHVTYGTNSPAANGTASAGSAATVSRSDHVHPTDTSRAAASHTHDDRYYTETEINTKLNGKSNSDHTHTGYALSTHDHNSVYAAASHNHDSVYSKTSHNHDTTYAAKSHTHSDATTSSSGQMSASDKGVVDSLNAEYTSSVTYNGMSFSVNRKGKIVSIQTVSGSVSSSMTSYTKYKVGTLTKNFHPPVQVSKIISVIEGVQALFVITTAGEISLTPYGMVPAGYTLLIHEMFFGIKIS